jgi:tryptophan 2,3-dioxygenase
MECATYRGLDQLLAWQRPRSRILHLQLVERVIGIEASRTGGTSGAKHLRQMVESRFFPALWQSRSTLACA